MSPRRSPGRRIAKSLLPIVLLVVVVLLGVVGYVVYSVTHPPHRAYLVTPERFLQLSSERGVKATDETWTNRDGTQARGWLLRGAEGQPAVIMLHRYGADRSWLLNLGIKINETTSYTVLWPDLRGHGLDPPVSWTSFGSREGEDVAAALDHLRTLKTPQGHQLVGERAGLYGVEMGAYAAMLAASRDEKVQALVLDSVPASTDDILRSAVRERVGVDNGLLQTLTRLGTGIYFLGHYNNTPACSLVSSLSNRRVLLLTGEDAPEPLRLSTIQLARCFPSQTTVEVKSDLPLTGFNLPSATGEQGELYDRRVIDFFDKALR
jgi:pimeloyl-ACP methyl ester carboxylesterase